MTNTSQPIVRHASVGKRVSRRLRRITESDAVVRALGTCAYGYFSLVRKTSSLILEPGGPFDLYSDDLPLIGTMWHGHHFILPFVRPDEMKVRVLISNHRDGAINAIMAERFGLEAVRGSGGRDPSKAIEKGGVRGLLKLKSSLEEGYTVVLTADIAKGEPRRASLGVITLARLSGRPIVGVGLASSRKIVMDNWERSVINLPFSRIAAVATPLVRVPRDANDSVIEEKRLELEEALNAATDRAYEIADQRVS
jgi:lysophospholipid acyltransferase (LPLAT)-like uncharacterized protein